MFWQSPGGAAVAGQAKQVSSEDKLLNFAQVISKPHLNAIIYISLQRHFLLR